MKPTIVLLVLSVFACVAQGAASEWVCPGPDGKLVYKTTPAGDRIMDFSDAGYMGGGVTLPEVPVRITVKPVEGDCTAVIQEAIDKVSAMPLEGGFRGAVMLAPGDYTCSGTISIRTGGVVLRGAGSGPGGSTIKMVGGRHGAISVGGGRQTSEAGGQTSTTSSQITDVYVPSGTKTFTVADASGFAAGDTISIRRPVTEAWIKFMQMDDLTRDGRPQTWIRAGTHTTTERTIAAISGNKITLDVPLTDSFDSRYLNPPGTAVVKVKPASIVTQVGVERLHIQAPPQHMSYSQAPYTAMRISGQDCWARDILIEETMNSVSVGGRRITLERVAVHRTVPNLGASKPAEFAPNAGQVLLDRCSGNGDNIWHVATGAGQAGPIVLLNCTFGGNGHIEGHQRWTTGMLLDNCQVPEGGIDFKNRGAMGSGHGWGLGWAVAWNCAAKTCVVQQPPGVFNWMIGCAGENKPTPRPFDQAPTLPLGTSDSPGKPVEPKSLYLAQLAERLGPQALKNIGYAPNGRSLLAEVVYTKPSADRSRAVVDKDLGVDVAARKLANTSNVRGGDLAFGGERALDGDPNTYWTTNEGVTEASLEVDLEEPATIGVVELREAKGFGQRVQAYRVEGQVNSDWRLLSEGTTIGERKVDRFPPVLAWKVRLRILKASASPAISTFGLYSPAPVNRR